MSSSSNGTVRMLQTQPPGWQAHASTHDNDIFWCKEPSEDTFLFTLDNAPYILYEAIPKISSRTQQTTFDHLFDAFFMLSTLTCYHFPVAKFLSNAIADHYRFQTSLRAKIYAALHEAIANAVIHGNLAIDKQIQSHDEFDTYCALIQSRLNLPEHSFSRIAIALIRHPDCLTLCVSDEGKGYQGNNFSSSDKFALQRGLSIIHAESSAVRISQSGTTIEMDFAI